MKIKAVSIALLAIMAFLLVVPVLAAPTEPQGNKVKKILAGGSDPKVWYIIFTESGWRQWTDVDGDGIVDRFANYLYTEGMNQKAIDAKVAAGWNVVIVGPPRRSTERETIFKMHKIPAMP